jgi:RNA polymerase sigma factor (sigma-70 family)
MIDDAELLRRYAEENSEAAFAELVHRRIDLVYSVALRTTGGDAHRAQDAAQRVFTDLARKAASLAQRPVLTGWLYRSARFAATDLVRAARRRQEREAAAHLASDSTMNHEPDWQQLRSEIDAALTALNERDRDALLLRFFEAQPFAAIAARLRLNEDAARRRVDRALEKLRSRLESRGVTSTATALAGAIGGQAAMGAPVAATAAITTAALAGGTVAGAGVAAWAAIISMSKIQVAAVTVLVLAGLASVAVEVRANRALNAEVRALQVANDHAVHLESENRQLGAALARQATANPDAAELVRLQQRVALLRARPDGVTDAALRAPNNAGRATPAAAFETFCWAVAQHDLDAIAAMFMFSDDTPENRDAFMAALSPAIRERYRTPERVCAAACFPNILGGAPDPAVAMQVTEVRDERPDEARLSIWTRTASGREIRGTDRYRRGPDGWGPAAVALRDERMRELVQARLDPRTGDPIYPTR